MSRDYVALYPNLRVDNPDLAAIQRNSRSEVRSAMLSLMYGEDVTTLNLRRVISGFQCSDNGDATLTIQDGTATGAELLVDGSREYGVVFGREGEASQILDFSSLGAGIYGVYVRFSVDPSSAGNRVFWDSGIEEEVIQTVATRNVVRWQAQVAASIPGTEWIRIAEVDWDGATVLANDITHNRRMFFEGNEGNSFAEEWGDGVNDRDADRGQYGVQSLYTFVHMVRRQLNEIINNTLPQSGHVALPAISLAETRTHVDDTSDPHGATLTQTNLTFGVGGVVSNLETVNLQDSMGDPIQVSFFISASELAACDIGRANLNWLNYPGQGIAGHSNAANTGVNGLNGGRASAVSLSEQGGLIVDQTLIGAGGNWIRFPVLPPPDTYLARFEVIATGVGATSSYTATLYRQPMSATIPTAMSTLTGTGTGDISQLDTSLTVPQTLDDVGYYVEIEVPDVGAADDLTIHGVRVGYVRGQGRNEFASEYEGHLSVDMPNSSGDYAWTAMLQGDPNKQARSVINLSDRLAGARLGDSCTIDRVRCFYYNNSGVPVDIRVTLVRIDKSDGTTRADVVTTTISTLGSEGVDNANLFAGQALDTDTYWYELEVEIVDQGTPLNDNFGIYGLSVRYEKSRVW